MRLQETRIKILPKNYKTLASVVFRKNDENNKNP